MKDRIRRFALGILAPALMSVGAAPIQPPVACFTRQDSRAAPLGVFEVAAPPPYSPLLHDYPPTAAAYPVTDFVTAPIRLIRSPTQPSASGFKFRKYALLWVNRCIQLAGVTPGPEACRNLRTKGNGYVGMMDDGAGDKVRQAFSTYGKADACTLIQARRLLGETAGLAASGRAAGLSVWDSEDRVGLARLARRFTMTNGQPSSYLVDTCVLEPVPAAPDINGLMLDYEVWDSRTPAQTLDIVRKLAQLTHQRGKQLLLITDPIPKLPSGLTAANVRLVIDAVDGFGSTISTGFSLGSPNIHFAARPRARTPWEAYTEELAVLTDGGRNPLTPQVKRKLFIPVGLDDVTLPEAQRLHDEFVRQGYRGVLLVRNFLRQGGVCDRPINQEIACLALGKCDGRFGIGRQ